ncbi:MAG: hydrogenase iron-sulfur subunit, partial [Chloroflexi bacterium]|nr:hydrogenase iron-sulfur subunit [Chloroflexota bacterium]
EQNNQHMEIITLPCVGTILPDVLIKALDAGAADIQVIGCPPEDCRNREGNVWTAQRLTRRRLPRLKRDYAQAPITAVWAAPNEFAEALQIEPVQKMNEAGEMEPDYMASRRLLRPLTWRNYVVAFVLLLLVLLAQAFLTDVPVSSTAVTESPRIHIVLPDPAAPLGTLSDEPVTLHLQLNGESVWSQPFTAAELARPFYIEQLTTPGAYDVRLFYDVAGGRVLLFDEPANLTNGDILRLHYQSAYPLPCFGQTCVN